MVSGAAVSAATLGPGQDGPSNTAAQAATTDRAAYQPNSPWGPHQTDVDARLQNKTTHSISDKQRADLKREEAQKRARARAKAAAKKRAAAAAKKAREAREAREARQAKASRSDDRKPTSGGGAAPKKTSSSSSSSSSSTNLSGSPKDIAKKLLAQRGWSDQFGCLDSLWTKESGWNVHADNPGSDAYGIPQALPGSKMASAGSDWQDSAATQIKWGLGYIDDTYGSPCAAWDHSQANNWY